MALATGAATRRDERIGIAAGVTAGFGLAAVVAGDGLGIHLACPLRTLTEVPCPGCGLTTVASSLAGGDVLGALAADPAGVVLVVVVAGILVLHLGDQVRRVRIRSHDAPGAPPARIRSFGAPTDRTLAAVAGAALAVHWATTLLAP